MDLDAIDQAHRQWTHTETDHGRPESICAECYQAWPCDASLLLERMRGAELASMGRALGRLLEQKRAAELEVPDQDIEALHDRCWQDADDTWWFAEGVECENPYMHTRPFTREEFRDFLGTVGTPKGYLS